MSPHVLADWVKSHQLELILSKYKSYLVVIHGPRRPAQPRCGRGGWGHRGGGRSRGARGRGGVVEVRGGHGGRVGRAVRRCRRRRVVVGGGRCGRRLQVVRPDGVVDIGDYLAVLGKKKSDCQLQRWAFRRAIGCVNLALWLPLAAGRWVTQPRAHLIARLCGPAALSQFPRSKIRPQR